MGSNSDFSTKDENDNLTGNEHPPLQNGFLDPEEERALHSGRQPRNRSKSIDSVEQTLALDDIASPFGPSSIRDFTFFNYEEIFGPIDVCRKSKIPVLSPQTSPTSPPPALSPEDELMSPYLFGGGTPVSSRSSRKRHKSCK